MYFTASFDAEVRTPLFKTMYYDRKFHFTHRWAKTKLSNVNQVNFRLSTLYEKK